LIVLLITVESINSILLRYLKHITLANMASLHDNHTTYCSVMCLVVPYLISKVMECEICSVGCLHMILVL